MSNLPGLAEGPLPELLAQLVAVIEVHLKDVVRRFASGKKVDPTN